MEYLTQAQKEKLNNKTVLVTGGTGFIGGRLVEVLMQELSIRVKVLMSGYTNASRIARFPVELIKGDIIDYNSVDNAVRECDFVFHCAYGSRGDEDYKRRVNVEGTKNILEASRVHAVQRVVHLSTMMVYGNPGNGVLNEERPLSYTGQAYPDSKLDAEKLVFDYYKRYSVPVSVIQPTVVYGPFGPAWTTNVLKRLQTKRTMLINGGDGYCNAVYIDDVVQAILLACVNNEAVGEAFLISSDAPVLWKEYFELYERMLGYTSTVDVSEKAALKIYKNSQKKSVVGRGLKYFLEIPPVRRRLQKLKNKKYIGWIFPRIATDDALNSPASSPGRGNATTKKRSLHIYSPGMISFFSSRSTVSIAKARERLGYKPHYDLRKGMEKTKQWAQWANILDT